MLQLNTILQNRYRVVRLLGKGGMGAVYEAVDQRVNCLVALKQTVFNAEEHLRGFQHEASLLANLRHAALPKVSDFFSEEGNYYLVMEHIPGDDLYKLLEKRKRPFDVEDVVRWGDELLKALEYLHGQQPPILHRDIKPPNLKLSKQNEIVLLDFGLAKGIAGQMPTLMASRSVHAYTLFYAPLEQIHGQGTDARSDLYSTAATLYHLITNETPASAPKRYQDIDEGHTDPLAPPFGYNTQVSRELSNVIMKAMALSRRDRYNNAKEMRQAWLSAAKANQVQKQNVNDLPVTFAGELSSLTEEQIITTNEDEKETLKYDLPKTIVDSIEKITELSDTKAVQTEGALTEAPQTEAAKTIVSKDENKGNHQQTIAVKNPQIDQAIKVKTASSEKKVKAISIGIFAGVVVVALIALVGIGLFVKFYLLKPQPNPNTPIVNNPIENTPTMPTGRTIETFTTPSKVYEIAAAPNGKTVVSVGEDSIVRIWKIDDITIPLELKAHTKPVRSVALSPNGKTLASGGDDKDIRLWSMSDGKLIKTLSGHTDWVFKLAFSPDGKTLASASGDKTIRLWNVDEGRTKDTASFEGTSELLIDFSKDLKTVAFYNAQTKAVRLWSVEDKKLVRDIEGNTAEIKAGVFSPDNQIIALGSVDGSVSLWNTGNGKLLKKIEGGKGETTAIAFNNDGRIISAGYGDGIMLWRINDGSLITKLTGHKTFVLSLSFSSDGFALFSGSEDKTIRLWEMK